MSGGLRQVPDFANQIFSADLPSLIQVLACNHFCNSRPTGHGWNTPLSAKSNFGDALAIRFHWLNFRVFQLNAQFQNVSTDGIFQSRACVGCFHRTGVTRILKMIEDFGGIHTRIVMRREATAADANRVPYNKENARRVLSTANRLPAAQRDRNSCQCG
jgi:hypothetical protein